MHARTASALLSVVIVFACVASAIAQPKGENRFNEMDPEIRKAAEIDFSTVDLEKTDKRTLALAGMALNEFLTVARNKAEHRVDLATTFLEQQGLLEEFGKSPPPEQPVEPMTFADGQKLAVAYVQTDAGSEAMAGKLTSDDPDMVSRVTGAYDGMNQKLWTETVTMRRQIDRIARYLDSKGKFDEFMTWAYAESKKAEAAHQDEMAKRQVEYAARMEKERAERQVVAEANAQRRHEEKMKQLELAYQYKTEKLKAQRDVSVSYNERYTPASGWGWDGDYYRNRYSGRYYRR